MVKNITIQGNGSTLTPGRQIIAGQLQCLGGAHAKARSGQDHYLRPAGQAWLIECVLGGSGFVKGPLGTFTLQAGDAYVLGPYAEFQYYPDDQNPWEKLFIEINGPLVEQFMCCYQMDQCYVYPQAHVQQQMEQLINLLTHSGEHLQRDFPIAIHRLINNLYFNGRRIPPNMTDYIEAHIHSEFTLEQMAQHFSLSKNQLLRRFKKQYQKSPLRIFITTPRRPSHLDSATHIYQRQRPRKIATILRQQTPLLHPQTPHR